MDLMVAGTIVLCIESSLGDRRFFHVSYVNYNTWIASLLELYENECPLRRVFSGLRGGGGMFVRRPSQTYRFSLVSARLADAK